MTGVESVPLMTTVKSSRAVHGHLESLLTAAARLDLHRLHRVLESGVERDDYCETLNTLRSHCQLYETDCGEMS